MGRSLVLAALLLLLGVQTAGAQDDLFVGDWTLDPLATSPWAEPGHVFSVTATTQADVQAFANQISGNGQHSLLARCLGQGGPGGLPTAKTFYSATYTWSGTGTVKGCSNERTRELYGTENIEFGESTRKATESAMAGYWSDNTLRPGSGYVLTASRKADCGSTRRVAHAAAVNEVRVVAVQPEVSFHRAGTDAGEWHDVCKDTVLQQGDEISCDPDGAVTLQFADNSTVVVKNTTQLKIASFFTEGGVVRTEILLKMGEIAAKVHKSEATKSDFHIKTPNLDGGSVRGTDFSAFYDPGSRTSLWSVREGTVDVNNSTGAHRLINAGQEAMLANGTFTVGRLGKAGARGGLNRRAALAKVTAVVAKADRCGVTTPRLGAYAVRPRRGGWTVTLKVIGKRQGTSSWAVTARRARPLNALARTLRRGCA